MPEGRILDEGLEDSLTKLLAYFFRGMALAKSYESGLKLAKEKNINIVTPEREVVYAEGYFTKVGTQLQEDQLTQYYSEQPLRAQLKTVAAGLRGLER
jgi:chromosome segregation ATPase